MRAVNATKGQPLKRFSAEPSTTATQAFADLARVGFNCCGSLRIRALEEDSL
jgi:hypothetical protein